MGRHLNIFMKAIIYLPHIESSRTPPFGPFQRSVEYDLHVWHGKDFDFDDPEEIERFNKECPLALASLPTIVQRPIVRIMAEPERIVPAMLEGGEKEVIPRKRHARLKPGFAPTA